VRRDHGVDNREPFKGVIDVADDASVDVERQLAAAFARD
jgi:hypothetical protein